MFNWQKFVSAWERVLGDEARSGRAVPGDELRCIRTAYKEWRDGPRARGESAEDWLRRHAGEFERLGYYKEPGPGEVKITSGWSYGVMGFDEKGNRTTVAPHHFAAARAFSYRRGPAGLVHASTCEHIHASIEDARECVYSMKMIDWGEPSIEDIESNMSGVE
jgi:hypothetical protein